MKMRLDKGFGKRLRNRIGMYEFDVGILQDKPHRDPVETSLYGKPELSTYAGGDIRKAGRKSSGKTVAGVLIANMERLNINLLLRPFQEQNSDLMKFTKAYLNMVFGKPALKRVENLLQAVVRNPILKQEYGRNKPSTADAKGFDRHLIDTAQMFKAIQTKAKRAAKR